MRLLAIAFAALLLLPGSSLAAVEQGPKLERLVLVQRHGVRSPTRAPEALAKFAAQPWHAWPVPPGILTDHGERDVKLMGAWLRADYARRGLWPAKGCPAANAVYAWADGKDQRTRLSGQATLDGAFPGCGLKDRSGAPGKEDGFFDASGFCPYDAEIARKAILAQVGGDLDHPRHGYDQARAALAKVLTPGAPPDPAARNMLEIDSRGRLYMAGPLADATSLSENLFLEYAQGMPEAEVGWGRAGSEAAIASIMPLHDISVDLTRRTPYIATHAGVLMMKAILGALRGQAALPGQGAPAAKLAIVSGHDTNLSDTAGILDVDWTLPGQPDKTPPDATLAFEVWKDASGVRSVRLALIYQTLDQLRRETPLDAAHPAGRVELKMAGCADGPDGACRLDTFVARVAARLPAECNERPPVF